MIHSIFLVASLAAVCLGQLQVPTSADYGVLVAMEQLNRLPWPHTGGHYRKFTNAQFKALGQQFFGSVPAPQNATALALVIYDYTTPDYRRPNNYLSSLASTGTPNITAFGEMITYIPPTTGPYIPRMFGLDSTTTAGVLSELQRKWTTVQQWCLAESNVLQFAMTTLPEVPYSSPSAPSALFRGDGRDVRHFCNQFQGAPNGLSIDACIATVFQVGSQLTVAPFWSSSSSLSVTNHYSNNVLYTLVPNQSTSVRSSWRARSLAPFTVDPGAYEWLYPSGSGFVVVSATCAIDPNDRMPFWNITLAESLPTVAAPMRVAPTVTSCISLLKTPRKAHTSRHGGALFN